MKMPKISPQNDGFDQGPFSEEICMHPIEVKSARDLATLYSTHTILRDPIRDYRLLERGVIIFAVSGEYRFGIYKSMYKQLQVLPGIPEGRVLEFKKVS